MTEIKYSNVFDFESDVSVVFVSCGLVALFLMSEVSAVGVVISLLVLCCVGGVVLSTISSWKGYLMVFTYISGLLVMIIYLASLTQWESGAKSLGLMMVVLLVWVEEQSSGGSSMGASILLVGLSVELLSVLLLFGLMCLFTSQLLFMGQCLRSFH